MIYRSTGLLQQLSRSTSLHLKLSTDTTQQWQSWIDIIVLSLFQFLIRLFNVAIWSECTDAAIIVIAERIAKFIKTLTQQEILHAAVLLGEACGLAGSWDPALAWGLQGLWGNIATPSTSPVHENKVPCFFFFFLIFMFNFTLAFSMELQLPAWCGRCWAQNPQFLSPCFRSRSLAGGFQHVK